MVSAYAIPRYLLEIYKTDEENFEPYVPNTSNNEEESVKDKVKEEGNKETDEETYDVEENKDGFTLHQGEIQEIYYYRNLHSIGWDHDYEDMSNSGSCEIPYFETDLSQCYLGVRLLLRVDWEEYNEKRVLKELPPAILGFITEERFNNGLTSLSLSGMDKTLEEEYQFEFTQMKRSEIITEMIKTANLKPDVDVTGLQDDVIDYSNVNSGDGDSGEVGGNYASINDFVKKAIKGKKGDRAKAEAIHNALKAIIRYSYYSCSNYPRDPEACLKNASHLNCADTSCLTCTCFKAAKLTARVVHGPNHFWTEVQIAGQWIASDLTGCEGCESRRSLGQVWNNYNKDRVCGDFPSC